MDEKKFAYELNDLVKEVGGLNKPQYAKLAMLARQACDNRKKLKQHIDFLQDSLDYLRICIKYQIFDLEATKRENKYLRKMLEEKNSRDL